MILWALRLALNPIRYKVTQNNKTLGKHCDLVPSSVAKYRGENNTQAWFYLTLP